MKKNFILSSLARLNMLFAAMMLFPFFVGIIYKEPLRYLLNFLIPAFIIFLSGYMLYKKIEFKKTFNTKDALTLVAICWLVYSIFGAIPFYLYPNDFNTFFDAFFESVAGFSTTGATIARDVESLPNSIIFWRSFAQFIGGLGIISLTVSILPKQSKKSTMIMKAESVGPTFGKITPKLSETARVLYTLYLSLTAVTVIALLFAGMNLFDSLIFAMGAAGTGGFANRGLSVGFYDSRAIEIILGIAMLLFGVNFNLYYYAIIRSVKDSLKSEELKVYLAIIAVSSILIFINILPMYSDAGYAGANSFFTVSSIITTTGYVSADFGKWPLFSRHLLTLLMFVGGCAGSTAGGIKVSRIIMLYRSAVNQVKITINPKRIAVNRLDGKRVDEEVEISTNRYLVIYTLLFILFMLVVTLDTKDLETAFTAVSATFNNIGPDIGQFGPMNSFTDMSYLSKFVLTFAMLFGRLEIYPMILLLSPENYKHLKNK